MAAVAPTTSTSHTVSPTHQPSEYASLRRMTSRKLFGRSRRAPPPPPLASSSELDSSVDSSTPANGNYADEKIFSSRTNNHSTSALSTTSTASRTSRFFRRFGRSKPPPVPSLPPTLVLNLDAGTAAQDVLTPPPSASAANPAPSAAAAIIAQSQAAYAAAETLPKPARLQRRRMLEALTNARLDVSQARDLIRLCGLHIRERGLDTSGLFRPFRIAESQDRVYHMIQLFLLGVDASTYIAVFPILPENALDRFGRNTASTTNAEKSKVAREELDKELRYANPHDVVSVFKWGLRHVRLRATDFNSKDGGEWYDVFVAVERESGYHARAIADLLHPKLPQATAELLSEVLDLMASVAAHSSSNHMPAGTLCRVVGFWLFGRIGVAHPPPTVDELLREVERTAGMAEHLLLAHIRSQAAVTFAMPLRLTELVERYPCLGKGGAPGLEPKFASREVDALRVDLRSENLVVSQAKPRSPGQTLEAALEAKAANELEGVNGGEEVWAEILAEDKGVEALLIDEHVRILRRVDDEFSAKEEAEESTTTAMVAAPTAATPSAAPSIASIKASRRRSQSLSDLRSFAAPTAPLATLPESRTDSIDTARPTATTPKRKPVPLLDAQEVISSSSPAGRDSSLFSGDLEPSASWRSFSEEGFGVLSSASSELSLSQFDLRPASTLPRSRSSRSIYRRSSKPVRPRPVVHEQAKQVEHAVTRAELGKIDSGLAVIWQDSLLDSSPACKLPQMVVVQLREGRWLVVVEWVVPPRPPTPPTTTSGDEDRRSIFAPSIKSVRMRLRRVSTVIGSGRRRGAPPVDDGAGLSGDREQSVV